MAGLKNCLPDRRLTCNIVLVLCYLMSAISVLKCKPTSDSSQQHRLASKLQRHCSRAELLSKLLTRL